jgi:hypothetical protein
MSEPIFGPDYDPLGVGRAHARVEQLEKLLKLIVESAESALGTAPTASTAAYLGTHPAALRLLEELAQQDWSDRECEYLLAIVKRARHDSGVSFR